MAERVLINKQILQDSIDAIRAKKGTTDSIVVADMPTEIASIEGGGSGIADSTKTLVNAISGVTPTDETTLNNAIAKAYADTPTEQTWNGTRSTADGGTIKDGIAFIKSIKGSTQVVDGNLRNFTHNSITSKDEDNATLDTLSLNVPSSVFPNGMNGVGTAFDEWKPSEGKAIKRMFEIVLTGNESWILGNPSKNSFKCTLPIMSASQDGSTKANAICKDYVVFTTNNIYNGNVGFGLNKKEMWFKDGVSTTIEELKASLSSLYSANNPVRIIYEELTPTETTTDKAKAFFKVANGGTESVSGGENSTPIKADIGYRGMSAEELVNAINI